MNDDRDWIAQLYQSYHAEIARYLIRMLRSTSTAEDLVQDTFIRVQRLGPTRVRSPRSLLYTVATRLAFRHVRRTKDEQVVFSAGPTSDSPDRTPAEIAQLDEALRILESELTRLSPRLSEVWTMRWVNERSREEIGRLLNLTSTAVDQRLSRAMVALRRKLVKRGFGGLLDLE